MNNTILYEQAAKEMKSPKLSAIALALASLTGCVTISEKRNEEINSKNLGYLAKKDPNTMSYGLVVNVSSEVYRTTVRTFEKLGIIRTYVDPKKSLYEIAEEVDENEDYMITEEEVDVLFEKMPESAKREADIRVRDIDDFIIFFEKKKEESFAIDSCEK